MGFRILGGSTHRKSFTTESGCSGGDIAEWLIQADTSLREIADVWDAVGWPSTKAVSEVMVLVTCGGDLHQSRWPKLCSKESYIRAQIIYSLKRAKGVALSLAEKAELTRELPLCAVSAKKKDCKFHQLRSAVESLKTEMGTQR